MCGIWGYSGKNFNKYKFNILGLYNDSRGGDSCGVFIVSNGKKQLSYGYDENKLYSDFIASGIELDFNNVNFALGHCRKASVGGIGQAQAQPVVIKDNNDKIKFVMIHNGTLLNYRELAKKHDVEFTYSETDSQIFARIVYKIGYKALGMYEGAGSFIFWDSRDGNNTIKVFKGASLYYEYDSKLYIERPLFCMKNKDSFWISSIENSLKFINDEGYEIKNLGSNILYTIMNGEIIAEDPIDRSKMKSCIPLAYNKEYYIQKQNFTTKERSIPIQYGYYDGYEDWFDQDESYKDYAERANGLKEKDKSFNNIQILDSKTTNKIIKESNYTYFTKDRIYFREDGLYYIDDKLCDGRFFATPAGYIDGPNHLSRAYYFVHGVMMKSFFDYLTAREYCSLSFKDCEPYQLFLAKYSTTPVPEEYEDEDGNKTVVFNIYDPLTDIIEFTGEFSPYFTFNKMTYKVDRGEIKSYIKTSEKNVYIQDFLSNELDIKIMGKQISKNELRKKIEENLW